MAKGGIIVFIGEGLMVFMMLQAHRQKMKESVHDLKESGQLESTVYQDDDQELIFSVRLNSTTGLPNDNGATRILTTGCPK